MAYNGLYMKCRRFKALTFQINGKGRLSEITAKTALTRLYFIYCVSHRFYYGYLYKSYNYITLH